MSIAAAHADSAGTIDAVTSVLVVEDEPVVRDVVVRYLTQAGYRTMEAGDGATAERMLAAETPGVVILDIMLPEIDGLELCRRIRAHSAVPIIMLTARGDEADRIVGLEMGADDYVTKPFSPRELVARVRAILRRSNDLGLPGERLEFGDLQIEPSTREVHRDGTLQPLTAREFDLLWFLASNPRQVFSREQIMDRVWGYRSATDTGTVTVHIRRLREKIEADPSHPAHLQTVWGVGYRFVP